MIGWLILKIKLNLWSPRSLILTHTHFDRFCSFWASETFEKVEELDPVAPVLLACQGSNVPGSRWRMLIFEAGMSSFWRNFDIFVKEINGKSHEKPILGMKRPFC